MFLNAKWKLNLHNYSILCAKIASNYISCLKWRNFEDTTVEFNILKHQKDGKQPKTVK